MKSGKQRRRELAIKKEVRAAKRVAREAAAKRVSDGAPVNYEALAPNNSYSGSEFMRSGRYTDLPFRCVDCGMDEIWTATQQKWWYEVAKGYIFSTARRCRTCRRKERERRNESRRVHLEGVERRRCQQAAQRSGETSAE